MGTAFTYSPVQVEDLTATDLRQEATEAVAQGQQVEAYTIQVADQPEAAQAIYLPKIGRLGIAWGADATWADVPDVETGIGWYFDDPDTWEAHN